MIILIRRADRANKLIDLADVFFSTDFFLLLLISCAQILRFFFLFYFTILFHRSTRKSQQKRLNTCIDYVSTRIASGYNEKSNEPPRGVLCVSLERISLAV